MGTPPTPRSSSSPAPRPASAHSLASLPARKPMMRARRIPLFEREVKLRLSAAALDLLWHDVAVMSEGEIVDGYYGGSTMITVDLARAGAQLSDTCDQATAALLEAVLRSDRRVHNRARALARRHAEERAGQVLGDITVELRITRQGRHFHIDADVEGTAKDF